VIAGHLREIAAGFGSLSGFATIADRIYRLVTRLSDTGGDIRLL
jgi:hypothetical protein